MSRSFKKRVGYKEYGENFCKKYDERYEYIYLGWYNGYLSLSKKVLQKILKEESKDGWESGWHKSNLMLRRLKTKRDKYKEERRKHGERTFVMNLSKYAKNYLNRKVRLDVKTQLIRYFKDEVEDVICEKDSRKKYKHDFLDYS